MLNRYTSVCMYTFDLEALHSRSYRVLKVKVISQLLLVLDLWDVETTSRNHMHRLKILLTFSNLTLDASIKVKHRSPMLRILLLLIVVLVRSVLVNGLCVSCLF